LNGYELRERLLELTRQVDATKPGWPRRGTAHKLMAASDTAQQHDNLALIDDFFMKRSTPNCKRSVKPETWRD
jgi:hypothetical protein